MEAIILAGGLGTRLSKIINDIPKPMAIVNSKPFLQYVLDYLSYFNITKVTLSVGYKHEIIKSHFKEKYKSINIKYAIETEPLGTGGGIKYALNFCEQKEILIINGDTFFNVDLFELNKFHNQVTADLTLSLKYVDNCQRYGSVKLNNELRIIGFEEKKTITESAEGFINGGLYLINKDYFNKIEFPEKFSFEKDFLEKHYTTSNFYGHTSNGYFIDIGIPEDYARAQDEFKKFQY